MSSVCFAGLLPLLLAAAPHQAEGSKPADTSPAPSNIRGAEYPRIHADLRVTFRIKAPNAQKIEFAFFWNKQAVSRAEERGRVLDRDHGPIGTWVPLLQSVRRRRGGQRPRQ
jgi:hypothetical protein